MVLFPNAKINLGLRITSKREDGYHDLNTVFFPIPMRDVLEVVSDPTPGQEWIKFTCSGLPIPGSTGSNLCIKAYHLLKKQYPALPPILMHLHKHIPMGAGLGGGSADGAFMIRLLNEKYKLGMDDEMMKMHALELGSDCPFFIVNQPVQANGRGEIMHAIHCSLSSKTIVLVCPGIHVSTADAFKQIKISPSAMACSDIVSSPIEDWKNMLFNDFEGPVFNLYPEIGAIKEKLYAAGAVYASMTGTGSTVFGIFDSAPGIDNLFPTNYLYAEFNIFH